MKYLLCGFICVFFATMTWSQDSHKGSDPGDWLESKNFIFKAETVTPSRGRVRQLNSPYDLVVKPDTVTAFLPYFGRAYVAPIDPSQGGIKFTTSEFDYELKKGRKKNWEVTIKPSGAQDVQYLYLTVYDNARATLRVVTVNRQPISFSGTVEEGTAAKKGF